VIQTEIRGADKEGVDRKVGTHSRYRENGMLVYTEPRHVPLAKFLPLINTENGAAMNIDAGFSGTPDNVHNGIDTVYWTGSNIIGSSVTFNSTDTGTGWPTDGTRSVYVNGPSLNDVWEFDKGSSLDLSGYVAITMQIYIDRRWNGADSVEIYGWDGSAEVGIRAKLEDYMNETNYDVAQSITIPLTEMELESSSITGLRMEFVANTGTSPEFYLDQIQVQQSGGDVEYRTFHNVERQFSASKFVISIVDALNPAVTNIGGMDPLSYNQLLGVSSLSNGILLRSIIDGEIDFSGRLYNLQDFLRVGFKISNSMSDGTNTAITLEQDLVTPLIIEGPQSRNYISMSISDDLTGLLDLRAGLRGYEVNVNG